VLVQGRISTTSLGRMLDKRGEQAGVKHFTWHDMRRTTAGRMLSAGVDIATVQKILGHADPRTTARYDRRSEETVKEAVGMLHVPYQSRSP